MKFYLRFLSRIFASFGRGVASKAAEFGLARCFVAAKTRDPMKFFHKIKEPFCGLSHGLGAVLSVAALLVLLWLADGRAWNITAAAIYGATLILLYAASATYHSLRAAPRIEALLQRLDHSAIFLLIAGSYTPICLLALRGERGWILLTAVWSLALLGVSGSLLWKTMPDWLRVSLYVVMGWLVVVALAPLRQSLSPAGWFFLLAGGAVYSVGTVIFALDKPHLWPGKFSAHDLWHVFVIGGSVCHFITIAGLVANA